MPDWYIYIMSNHAHTLYTGMTNDLPQRVLQHKNHTYPNAFTARYTFDRLVYYEPAANKNAAALREKRVKNLVAREARGVDSIDQSKLERSEREV